jgi:F-type H+-transporting ATPase subunit delta
MGVEAVARRYAAALADVVVKSGEAETVKAELRTWAAMLASNAELGGVFANPAIAHMDKESILEKLIAKARPGKTTANFLRVLLRNGRMNEIAGITERFEAELEIRSGNVVANVTSARELSEKEKADLVASLAKITGRNIKPAFAVDTNIIGGVVTQIGSTVYDGSVRTQLENLKTELIGA